MIQPSPTPAVRGGRFSFAFTLVELLVVIAIIALLIGILLPAISKAKALAQSTVCLAHLRGAGTGMATYATENNGWLAGPNTSGVGLNDGNHTWGEDPTEPVQNMDWISPTLGDSLGLPGDRDERILEMFNSAMRCPANKLKYDSEYTGTGSGNKVSVDATQLKVASYSSPALFHMVGLDIPLGSKYVGLRSEGIDGVITIPGRYRPKLSRIGFHADKALAMDGARYVKDFQISFNAFTKQIAGGNYITYGPSLAKSDGGDPYKWVGTEVMPGTEQYAYRHPGTSMNFVFFDGHAENLNTEESLAIKMYAPGGTRIDQHRGTKDPNDRTGDVLD